MNINVAKKISNDEIKTIICICVLQLQKNEGKIIADNINECTITHKLAEYLQLHITGYIVDVGYNRVHDTNMQKQVYAQLGRHGIPDIIIHQRGTDNNILAIEIKKQKNKDKQGRKNDFEKLEFLTKNKQAGGLGYQLGLFLDIPQKDWTKLKYIYYIDGKKQN